MIIQAKKSAEFWTKLDGNESWLPLRSTEVWESHLLCLLIFGIVVFEISACYEADNPEKVLGFIQYIIFNLKVEVDTFYLYSYIGAVKKKPNNSSWIKINIFFQMLGCITTPKINWFSSENEVFLYAFMALLAESLLRNSVVLNNS